jgi:hypothetical protein
VLHFFLSHLLHSHPGQCLNSSLSGTLDVAASMMQQRQMPVEAAPPLHKTVMQIVRAAAKHEPMQLLLAVNASLGSGSWVASHAAMLLYRDPRFSDALEAALPSVRHPFPCGMCVTYLAAFITYTHAERVLHGCCSIDHMPHATCI